MLAFIAYNKQNQNIKLLLPFGPLQLNRANDSKKQQKYCIWENTRDVSFFWFLFLFLAEMMKTNSYLMSPKELSSRILCRYFLLLRSNADANRRGIMCHNIHVDAVRFHTCVQRMNLLKYKKSLVVLLRRCDDNQEYLNRNDIAFYSTQEGNKQFTVQYTRH